MSDMLRHVAKLANTDQRCVVAFMQIPGREDHALVIPIDNLPPRMEQAVMDVLNTPEGQSEESFALALSRRLLPDNGQNILEALHTSGRLTAVPVSQVLMMPRPNQPVKLSTVLESLNRLPSQESSGLMEDYSINKFNPHVSNQQANNAEQNRSIARNLLVTAEMLEVDAKRKREQAYTYDPSLRPTKISSMQGPSADAKLDVQPLPVIPMPDSGGINQERFALADETTDTQNSEAELLTMMTKLMERVEAQDKILTELQSVKVQDAPVAPKQMTRVRRATSN